MECHENRCRSSSYRATGRFEYRERVGAIRFKQRQFPTDNGWRVGLQGHKELENQKKESPEVGHRGGPGPPRGQTLSLTARSERVERQRPHTPQRKDPLLSSAETTTSSQTKPKSMQASPAKHTRSQPTNSLGTTNWSSEDPLGLDLQLSPDLSVDLSGNL